MLINNGGMDFIAQYENVVLLGQERQLGELVPSKNSSGRIMGIAEKMNFYATGICLLNSIHI